MTYKNKICEICGCEYTPTSSRQRYCENCKKEGKKNYDKKWANENKDKIKKRDKKYYDSNKDKCKERHKIWKSKNLEHLKEYNKQWEFKHRKERNEYRKNKRKNDLNLRLTECIRAYFKRCLKSKKTNKTFDILTYTPQQLKNRLEIQFKNGMNWDNYGIIWEIDHKKPIKMFNFLKEDGTVDYKQIKIANSLANLQPMLIHDNRVKGCNFVFNT